MNSGRRGVELRPVDGAEATKAPPVEVAAAGPERATEVAG